MAIPEQIMNEIVDNAKADWPDDKDMQNYIIKSEIDAYRKFEKIDFSGISEKIRDTILAESKDNYYGNWEERVEFIEEEISALREIENISKDTIDKQLLDKLKKDASAQNEYSFTAQLEFIQDKIRKIESSQKIKTEIEPIKDILIAIEDIIGNSCYNDNIQNYSSWGELESVGRSFRYPVKFSNGENEYKRRSVSKDIPAEDLMTGHYAFGANQLNIYRAIYKALKYLEKEHEFVIPQSLD